MLVIVTSPVFVSPGIIFVPVRIAAPLFEFECVKTPELNVLAGLALAELNVAPEPTATPTARRAVARPVMVRLWLLSIIFSWFD